MKERAKIRIILLYLFRMEDTTAGTISGRSSANSRLENDMCWLGPLKTVLWSLIAVLAPICLALFSH